MRAGAGVRSLPLMNNAVADEWEVDLDEALGMPKDASDGGSAFWDELHFPSKRGEVSKYLCISTKKSKDGNDPDYKRMGTLVAPALFNTLKMPPPSLVITVTGFARSVTEDELPYKQRVDISTGRRPALQPAVAFGRARAALDLSFRFGACWWTTANALRRACMATF